MNNKFIFLFLLLLSQLVVAQEIYPLAQWKVKQLEANDWLNASVPGNVQLDLLNNRKIEHPYLGTNEFKIDWIEGKSWVYLNEFKVSASQIKSDEIILNFEGLDTFADVYLNDSLILRADNMFRHWKIPVKKNVKVGKNQLKIIFRSTLKEGERLAGLSSIKYPADNERGSVKISPLIRKAPFQFGWDFGPRVLTTGIWKPTYLSFIKHAEVTDININGKLISKNLGQITAVSTINVIKDGIYTITVKDHINGHIYSKKQLKLSKGLKAINSEINIDQPKLWWPNGKGAAHLYQLDYEVQLENQIVSTKKLSVGIRNIEVVNEPDSLGVSFYFKINGQLVYIKGANYVPVNALPDPKSDSIKLKKLFLDMKESNFNMVRIWGGGMYESDYFYDLADEFGILVWQDFPFACTMYPSDPDFLKSIENEAIDNIKRLRNRTSLAIWCGNNEIDVGWKNWGWQKTYGYSELDIIQLENGYNSLFKKLLPNLLKELDPDRFYFHSSPISNWGKKEDFKIGDNHFWGVYHGEYPFESYAEYIPRFNSEFGFQSFPSWSTLKEIAGPNPKLTDSVLSKRQKSYKGNALLTKYMNWYYQHPADDETYVYYSQLQQAEGMKLAILASRASQPFNMGVLMWQLNDVWPAISWSAIEFNGKWKAAQYFIKDAFKPQALYLKKLNDKLSVNIISDEFVEGVNLKVVRYKFSGEQIKTSYQFLSLQQGNSAIIIDGILDDIKTRDEFIYAELEKDGHLLAENFYFLEPVKDLNLPELSYDWKLKKTNEGYYLEVMSDVFIKNFTVWINDEPLTHFDKNFIDLLPNIQNKIHFKTALTTEELMRKLRFRGVKNQTK
ncbi:glycoside hydrolase family 2 protein [Pedobacter flavus]|uniref:beta-mannosidase n=1 Tax=Pedobacter flavus TaxID=3113906 RepID=A0ABU7GZ41_9SPHI|nr:glycoside hydrolase family 2 protein [Pedobacter sp. VNH31]MEE1884230.1 glycoside hydrolase family 2 protein [Pedobacter sp. VNH31]